MRIASNLSGDRLIFPWLRSFYTRGEAISHVVLRAGFGLSILTHGLPKLLGTPHGSMKNPFAGATRMIETSLGLPFAPQLAMLITGLETAGALALAIGLFTRPIAAMFAVQMVFISFALRANFAWIDRGWEFPLVLGLIAVFLFFRGGGPLSIDRLLKKEL